MGEVQRLRRSDKGGWGIWRGPVRRDDDESGEFLDAYSKRMAQLWRDEPPITSAEDEGFGDYSRRTGHRRWEAEEWGGPGTRTETIVVELKKNGEPRTRRKPSSSGRRRMGGVAPERAPSSLGRRIGIM